MGNVSDLFLAERCVLCSDLLLFNSSPFGVCARCAALEPLVSDTRCRICSRPLISEIEVCTRCRNREYAFSTNRSAFLYRDEVAELLHCFKAEGNHRLAQFFASFLHTAIGTRAGAAVLIPVPASRSGRRKRGFDQGLLLARSLSRRARLPLARVLTRRGGTEQKTLDERGRAKNMIQAIRIRRGLSTATRRKLRGRNVILVDDVFTTGASLNACATVLRDELESGEVHCVTVALD
jgi:ComF family protein